MGCLPSNTASVCICGDAGKVNTFSAKTHTLIKRMLWIFKYNDVETILGLIRKP